MPYFSTQNLKTKTLVYGKFSLQNKKTKNKGAAQ
jgi:hypothetical protein